MKSRTRHFTYFVLGCLGLLTGLLLASLIARADSSTPPNAFLLYLDPTGISASEMAPLEAFVASVQSLIPPAMQAEIGHPIRVRFSKMSGNMTQLAVPACMGPPTTEADPTSEPGDDEASSSTTQTDDKAKMELLGHDNYSGRASVVDLNTLFIQEILDGPNGTRTYDCGHKNMYQLAVATLIHELAHVYDARMGKQESTKNSYFQRLMGFTDQRSWKTLFLIPQLKAKNRMFLRSPDPYEFKNIKETFAVNMEYFVLDPEFGCRRPAVDAYYRQILGITTQPSCQLDTKVYLNSDDPSVNLKSLVDLDPSRIYDIHYLFASESPQIMSRWGHAMFRIIVCAPTRKTVGPECLQDVQYHLVLSYRADVSDLILSNIKGVDGGYPSQLYVLSLPEILNEYNKLQLRNLISLPLNLTQEQKTQFLYRTLEQYWEYQGRYYFITNNCAEEAETMLQGVVPDEKIQKLHDLSPIGLYDDLNKLGMTDKDLVTDQQTATEQGYYFPSKQPILDTSFATINGAISGGYDSVVSGSGGSKIRSSSDYMNKTSADQRRQYFNAVMSGATDANRVKLAASFYLLESYISSNDQQNVDTEVAQTVEKMSSGGNDVSAPLLEALEGAQPWNQLTTGYGVPQPEDFDPTIAQSQSASSTQAYQQFQTWMQANFQSELQEFQKIQLNMAAFAQAITAGALALPMPQK